MLLFIAYSERSSMTPNITGEAAFPAKMWCKCWEPNDLLKLAEVAKTGLLRLTETEHYVK